MPTDLFTALQRIEAEDGQLKEAGEKLGHEPEHGHMDGAGLESPLGQALGRGPMDAKAILDEKGLREAGRDLEGRTWQDPREAAGARNLGNKPGMGGVMPTQQGRHLTRPTNVSITGAPASHRPDSLAGKTASWLKNAGKYSEISTEPEHSLPKGKGNPESLVHKAKVKADDIGGRVLRSKTMDRAARAADHVIKHKGRYGAAAGAAALIGGGAYAYNRHRKSASFSLRSPIVRHGKAYDAAAKAGKWAKKHKGAIGATVAAGGAGYAAGRRKKASLSEYMQAYYAGEAGIKLANQAYDEGSVFARDIQRREFVSVGCGLAEGMLVSKLAEQNRS